MHRMAWHGTATHDVVNMYALTDLVSVMLITDVHASVAASRAADVMDAAVVFAVYMRVSCPWMSRVQLRDTRAHVHTSANTK